MPRVIISRLGFELTVSSNQYWLVKSISLYCSFISARIYWYSVAQRQFSLRDGQNLLMWKQTEGSSKGVNPQDGEGWLVNDQQGLVCEFSVDDPSIQDSWITIRTFRWRKPDYPIPQSRRRLLRDGAIEEWKRMQAAGWRRCFPPVR